MFCKLLRGLMYSPKKRYAFVAVSNVKATGRGEFKVLQPLWGWKRLSWKHKEDLIHNECSEEVNRQCKRGCASITPTLARFYCHWPQKWSSLAEILWIAFLQSCSELSNTLGLWPVWPILTHSAVCTVQFSFYTWSQIQTDNLNIPAEW